MNERYVYTFLWYFIPFMLPCRFAKLLISALRYFLPHLLPVHWPPFSLLSSIALCADPTALLAIFVALLSPTWIRHSALLPLPLPWRPCSLLCALESADGLYFGRDSWFFCTYNNYNNNKILNLTTILMHSIIPSLISCAASWVPFRQSAWIL